MITTRHLKFNYKRFGTPLFEDLNMNLDKGSICCLLGKNGEGKTTLLKLIAGQLMCKKDSINVMGYDPSLRQVDFLQNIYMLPEQQEYPPTRVCDYYDIIGAFYPNYSRELAIEILNEFGLDEQRKFKQMSQGECKKAVISFAFAVRTPILLLDEPTNGLDITGKSIFRRLLIRYASEEQFVIISTHQIRDLEQVIDQLLILNNNEIVCNEPILKLMEKFSIDSISPYNKDKAIYSEPTVGGEMGVFERKDGDEEDENFSLELFFSALLQSPEKVQCILNQSNKQEDHE